MPGSHRDERDAGGGRRRSRYRSPEQRPARLVDDEHRKRGQHRRAVEHDVHRIGARHLRDEREEAVPERERVAGMQPAVRELVRAPEREVAERQQLLDPCEMEEAVAADVPRDVPEEEPEQRARGEHDPRWGSSW